MAGWSERDTQQAIRDLEDRIVRHDQAQPLLDAEAHSRFGDSLRAELDAWLCCDDPDEETA